jgi:hypothetical protein
MAWGAGVAAAWCLHPVSRIANAPLNTRERTNLDLEDIISDKGLSPQKTTKNSRSTPSKIRQDRTAQDALNYPLSELA